MSRFRADCSQCCGLCCVVPPFLAVQGFGKDKRADTACAHLNCAGRCSIHTTRDLHGYIACQGFDCYGAGQWITQDLFAGATWADGPKIAGAMFAAYRRWLPRFEAAALLEAALPYVREDAQPALAERMERLSAAGIAEGIDDGIATDPGEIRRDTLRLIRAALAGRTNPRA